MASVVGVGDMRLCVHSGEILFAPEIGAGIALALHDNDARVTGILHFLLPSSEADPVAAVDCPALFADTGIPAFLQAALALGVCKERARIALIGGARPFDSTDFFALGTRNVSAARSILRREGLHVEDEQVGGTAVRALRIDASSGSLRVRREAEEREL